MKAIETSRYLEAWKFLLSSSFLVKRELVCADVFSINGFPQFPKLIVLILQFAWNFDRKKKITQMEKYKQHRNVFCLFLRKYIN